MKKLSAFLLWTALLVSGLAAQDQPAPSSDDVNYAFGVLMGESLASTGLDFDLTVLGQALKDSLGPDHKTRMDSETAKKIIGTALQAARAKADAAKISEEKTWLDHHAAQKGVKVTPSGLQYEVVQEGTGARPVAQDTVEVNYVGSFTDGKTFDSSIERGEPAVFRLDRVIPAWTEGLQLMTVGSKYKFTIPSKLAYGADGAGGVIPPYATLVFEVELLSIEAPSAEEGDAEGAPAPNADPAP